MRYDTSLASGQTITALQKRRHPSPATIITTGRSESENELPEKLPKAEPSLSVSELSLYVVTFVHMFLSLSRNQMFQKLLPFQSSAIQHFPVPATILPVVICSVGTLALWVVHITM